MPVHKKLLRAAAVAALWLFGSANNFASAQSIPLVQGDYVGTLGALGLKLHIEAAPDGTLRWSQGASMPLAFTRDTFVPAEQPSRIDGIWLGTAQVQGFPQPLRTQFIVKSDSEGRQFCTVDSPLAPPPVTYIPAIDPVSAPDMEAVLRRDLEKTFSSGLLASGKPTGIAVGVVRNGERRIFTFGTAKTDSMFEIGSITKVFTGLMLAQMIEQGKVQAETKVRELLPNDAVEKPKGAEITLLDLVTQHSGLPRLPDNLQPADLGNPYADYRAANLYQFLGRHGVAKPRKPTFLYSNLGVGLLGQALANRAQTNYPDLLKRLVLDPLKLSDTAITLSPDQQRRFITGYSATLQPAHSWELDSLAGAGAIRSTAGDMLKYLEANLHPKGLGATLPAALARSHEPLADVRPNTRIAYAWFYDGKTGTYWHNGGTGGFASYALFNPQGNYAAIVLVNVAVGGRGSFADQLGQHIAERFAGKPAVSLENW